MSIVRYTKLKEISLDSVIIDCPVEVAKGAILFDNSLNTTLLQLKLLNISDQTVTSVFIKVYCFDAADDEITAIEPVEFAYLDINAKPKSTFGERTPVILNSMVRNVEISIEKVTTADGAIWRNFSKPISLPVLKPLQDLLPDLYEQLTREATAKQINKSILIYFPYQSENNWTCICGRLNPDDLEKCVRCDNSKDWIFTFTNKNYLLTKLSEHNERTRQSELEDTKRKQQEEEDRKSNDLQKKLIQAKKRMIYTRLLILAAIFVSIFYALYIKLLEPYKKYSIGIYLVENSKFDEAITHLSTMTEYRNVDTWIKEAKYRKAINLMEDKQYKSALTSFEEIKEYSNSKELINETKYRIALDLIKNKSFSDGIRLLDELNTYKDSSSELIPKAYYDWFTNALDNNSFNLASSLISKIDQIKYPNVNQQYLSAKEKHDQELKEISYAKAKSLAGNGEFKAAFEELELLGTYKDSAQLIEQYKKEAFKWVFTGGTTKSSYSKYDNFSIYGKLTGGKPDATIDLVFYWKTPDWTRTDTSKGWFDGSYWLSGDGLYVYNINPQYAHSGSASVTVKVKSTGEVLAVYYFTIY